MEHQIIAVEALARVPWRNGRGTTREIAVEESAARAAADAPTSDQAVDTGGPEFLWRLSLADLVSDGEFSALPGVDRIFTLATPGPVELSVSGRVRRVVGGCPQSFAGEEPVRIGLGAAGPQQALNLMVDRARARGDVQIVELRPGPLALTGADVGVAVLSGRVVLDDGRELGPSEVLRPGGSQLSISAGAARAARLRVV